jgi:hypothetical protein
MIEDIYRDDPLNQPNSIRKNLEEEFTDQYGLSRAQISKLYQQINEFRSKFSVKEYYEDPSITEAMQSSEVTNFDQLVNVLKHRVDEKDISVVSSVARISEHSLLNLRKVDDLEKTYRNVINEMISNTYRDMFLNSTHNNISISTCYSEDTINVDIILSKTIFSVDSITRQNGIITIIGCLNDDSFSLFALILRDQRYEAVISPNQISYDYFNKIFYIKFEEKALSKMKGDIRIYFYVKRGKNTVKYGQGNNLYLHDITRMLNILILAYETSLTVFDSIKISKSNFLASMQKENMNLNSKSFQVNDIRQFANSPKFNLFGFRHRRSSSLQKHNRLRTAKKTGRSPDIDFGRNKWIFRSKLKNGILDSSSGRINPEDEVMKSSSPRKLVLSARQTPNKFSTFQIENDQIKIPSPIVSESGEKKLKVVTESARFKLDKYLLFFQLFTNSFNYF